MGTALLLQCPNISSEIHLGRKYGVVLAMSGDYNYLNPFDHPTGKNRRRHTIRSFNFNFAACFRILGSSSPDPPIIPILTIDYPFRIYTQRH